MNCGVKSVKCGVCGGSVECEVRSGECGVWSVKWSAKC